MLVDIRWPPLPIIGLSSKWATGAGRYPRHTSSPRSPTPGTSTQWRTLRWALWTAAHTPGSADAARVLAATGPDRLSGVVSDTKEVWNESVTASIIHVFP